MIVAVELDGAFDVGTLVRHVALAESAGFALVTLNDDPLLPGRVEAGVRAAFLSRRTSRIGLAPTLHPALTEPFHLATQLAALDHATLGRAAWVVGAANSAAAHATIGSTPVDLRRELQDVIEAARQLWDSWEDDAIIRDVPTGRFLDADRVHHVNFPGHRFSVAGPLITPRPPQGRLVVLGDDTLGVTGSLDVALIAAPGLDELESRARQARADGAPLVLAEVDVRREPGERLPFTEDLPDRLDGVVDGVRLHLADPEFDLPRLAALDLSTQPQRPTLRGTLGLPRPVSRYAAQREDRRRELP